MNPIDKILSRPFRINYIVYLAIYRTFRIVFESCVKSLCIASRIPIGIIDCPPSWGAVLMGLSSQLSLG